MPRHPLYARVAGNSFGSAALSAPTIAGFAFPSSRTRTAMTVPPGIDSRIAAPVTRDPHG